MKIDGVQYEVPWRKFKRGMSITVPCLDPDAAYTQIRAITDRLGMQIVAKIVLVDGIRALRVWRV